MSDLCYLRKPRLHCPHEIFWLHFVNSLKLWDKIWVQKLELSSIKFLKELKEKKQTFFIRIWFDIKTTKWRTKAISKGHSNISVGSFKLFFWIFTGRNEVVAKVIFLHLSVIHSVHRGGLIQCMLGYPPGTGTPPPPGQGRPPGPGRPPRTRQTPPGPDRYPPGKLTPVYGLRAAGTHPTEMHSCNSNGLLLSSECIIYTLHYTF